MIFSETRLLFLPKLMPKGNVEKLKEHYSKIS